MTEMNLCDPMIDPYNREKVLQLQIEGIEPLAMAAADELLALAEDTRICHTTGDGEWPDSEMDAKAEYDKLIKLAGDLRESMAMDPEKKSALLDEYYSSLQTNG